MLNMGTVWANLREALAALALAKNKCKKTTKYCKGHKK